MARGHREAALSVLEHAEHGATIEPTGSETPAAPIFALACQDGIYSPDFNPIENAFAKLKAVLRKAAQRTVEALWQTIGALLATFTPTECATSRAAFPY